MPKFDNSYGFGCCHVKYKSLGIGNSVRRKAKLDSLNNQYISLN